MNPVILLVAFGTMSPAAREVYAALESDVRAAHPGHAIRWAWTAKSLVARMRERGETVSTLGEALESLRSHGPVAILSLHLVPGEKHRQILAEDSRGLHVACGEPLLSDPSEIESVAKDLLAELPSDRPVMVVAHGHAHEDRFNKELRLLGIRLREARSDVHLTRLEGDDDSAGLEAFMARARALDKVHVVPFLLVAGDHVRNDILGDDHESLKSRMGVADFTCDGVLGRKPWVRQRFLQRLDAALAELERA